MNWQDWFTLAGGDRHDRRAQTNLMVYGPGGYRFGDYLRLGLPLTAAVVAVILVGVPIAWPL